MNYTKCMRREKNQLDASKWFIALIICSTCFGHSYAHHQDFETICVLLPPMVCSAWLLVVGSQVQAAGYASRKRDVARIGSNNTHIVSSSWWWAQKCQKHVEHIISAINYSVASSWFFFCTLYYSYFWNMINLKTWTLKGIFNCNNWLNIL